MTSPLATAMPRQADSISSAGPFDPGDQRLARLKAEMSKRLNFSVLKEKPLVIRPLDAAPFAVDRAGRVVPDQQPQQEGQL